VLNLVKVTHFRRWMWLIVGVLLLAMLLRLWSINKESFWADEGWSMVLSKGPTPSDVTIASADDQHPPLYFLLLHYWIAAAGNSEFAARLLSTFWSLLGVALVYAFGKMAFNSPLAGLLAALMLALADNDIMLAQETRHYTQLVAFAVLSGWFYLRYLRRPTRTHGLGWWAANVALMYTHYLGIFIIAVQFFHSLLFARPLRRKLDHIVRLALVGMAWLPWFFVFLNQSSVRYTRPIIYRNSIPNTPETFVTIRTDLFGGQFALLFGLMLLGLVYVTYRDALPQVRLKPLRPTLYLLLWFLLPILVIVGINSKVEILTPRNFLFLTPAIALLIGHGLTNLEPTARRFLLVIIVFFALTTVDSYFVKPPWRQVAQDVLDYRLDDEPVIMDVWVDGFALRYHLGRDLHTDPDTLPLVFLPEWQEKYTDQFYVRLLEFVQPYDSLWLVQWSKDEAGLVEFLNAHGFKRTATQIETHLTTNIISIWRYDREPQTAPLAQFGTLLALRRAQSPSVIGRGKKLPVSLLWQALTKPDKEYSTSVFLLDPSGKLVAQQDGPPLAGKDSMQKWQAGELHFDQPKINVPAALPTGEYTIGLKVYFYLDPQPLAVTPGGEYYPIGKVTIH
jgi:hypothetical protein